MSQDCMDSDVSHVDHDEIRTVVREELRSIVEKIVKLLSDDFVASGTLLSKEVIDRLTQSGESKGTSLDSTFFKDFEWNMDRGLDGSNIGAKTPEGNADV